MTEGQERKPQGQRKEEGQQAWAQEKVTREEMTTLFATQLRPGRRLKHLTEGAEEGSV